MKKFFLILTIFILNKAFSQSFNNEIEEQGKKILVGKINKQALMASPYKSWFVKNYNEYSPKEEMLEKLKDSLNEYTLTLYMGTWCGDSKKQVPRIYKILEQIDYPLDRLTVVAVHRTNELYKQSPGGEHEGQNIHRVPTLLISKKGEEVSRLVEKPRERLEFDLYNMINGRSYKTHYYGVEMATRILEEKGIEAFMKDKKK